MPLNEDLKSAHQHSINHRQEVEQSDICGCFHCTKIYPPTEIKDWLEDKAGTALCPYCGVDAVIGDKSGYPITEEFLTQMRKHWFY